MEIYGCFKTLINTSAHQVLSPSTPAFYRANEGLRESPKRCIFFISPKLCKPGLQVLTGEEEFAMAGLYSPLSTHLTMWVDPNEMHQSQSYYMRFTPEGLEIIHLGQVQLCLHCTAFM